MIGIVGVVSLGTIIGYMWEDHKIISGLLIVPAFACCIFAGFGYMLFL